jgi:hypothetical protein
MDEAAPVQNRRERRANVLLSAIVESCGRTLSVKLRNLSADGALVEADELPPEGAEISFHRRELAVPGKVIWASNRRAGIQFDTALPPETLLRHVPTPRPRVLPSFRRPGLAPQPITSAERNYEKQ